MKIGLEIHVQLNTKTKLFCGCLNKFTEKPNIYTCELCLGLPGSKPRLNEKAVEFAKKISIALNCQFPQETFFSRKSYFYPDMAKNFQITQYEIPIAKNGFLEIGNKKIRIRQIQIEEDPARLVHQGGMMKADYSLVDYNRSGVPLCEIVTEPDFFSTKQVRFFLNELSSILEYLEVFDPSIEGSMRVDANISVDETRVEIKNISGFKDVEKALNYEILRQKSVLRRGDSVLQETRAWDDVSGITRSLRTKESEEDYGYIFDSDLPKITVKNIDRINLPELPREKIKRYIKEFKMKKEIAISITSEPSFALMFENVVKNVDQNLCSRWFAGVIKKTLNFNNKKMKDTKLKEEQITKLLKLVESKKLTEKAAELLFRKMVKNPQLEIRGMSRMSGVELKLHIKDVIHENSDAVFEYKSGKKEIFHFLVGQVMKKTKGRGDPDSVRKLLKKSLS